MDTTHDNKNQEDADSQSVRSIRSITSISKMPQERLSYMKEESVSEAPKEQTESPLEPVTVSPKIVYTRYPVYGPPNNTVVGWVDNVAIDTQIPGSIVVYHPDDPDSPTPVPKDLPQETSVPVKGWGVCVIA